MYVFKISVNGEAWIAQNPSYTRLKSRYFQSKPITLPNSTLLFRVVFVLLVFSLPMGYATIMSFCIIFTLCL